MAQHLGLGDWLVMLGFGVLMYLRLKIAKWMGR